MVEWGLWAASSQHYKIPLVSLVFILFFSLLNTILLDILFTTFLSRPYSHLQKWLGAGVCLPSPFKEYPYLNTSLMADYNTPLDESDEAHQKVYGQEKHEGKLSHELIAGAASFEAMKAWEDRQRKEGKETLTSTPHQPSFARSGS